MPAFTLRRVSQLLSLLMLLACLQPVRQAAVVTKVRAAAAAVPLMEQESVAEQAETPIPLVPLITNTPQENGAIIHIVGYGQTLWSIAQAYNINVDQIRTWNNIAADSNDIYAGEKLLVRPAGVGSSTFTPQPSATPNTMTAAAQTVSARPEPTKTRRIIPTAQHTLTPTPAASVLSLSAKTVPFWTVAILIAGCVLLIVLFVTRKK